MLIFYFNLPAPAQHSSPVNTYDTEWHCLSADQHPDRIAAERYLSMPPRKREPWEDEVAEMVAAMGGVVAG